MVYARALLGDDGDNHPEPHRYLRGVVSVLRVGNTSGDSGAHARRDPCLPFLVELDLTNRVVEAQPVEVIDDLVVRGRVVCARWQDDGCPAFESVGIDGPPDGEDVPGEEPIDRGRVADESDVEVAFSQLTEEFVAPRQPGTDVNVGGSEVGHNAPRVVVEIGG